MKHPFQEWRKSFAKVLREDEGVLKTQLEEERQKGLEEEAWPGLLSRQEERFFNCAPPASPQTPPLNFTAYAELILLTPARPYPNTW